MDKVLCATIIASWFRCCGIATIPRTPPCAGARLGADVNMSIDARLEVKVAEILRNQLKQPARTRGGRGAGPGDRRSAGGGELPAAGAQRRERRVRGQPRGSIARVTGCIRRVPPFKVVTAMAALRKDMQLAHRTYQCIRLPDGRVGQYLKAPAGRSATTKDRAPHGTLDLERGLVVSCNAYFAQLGAYDVGADGAMDLPETRWASRRHRPTAPIS